LYRFRHTPKERYTAEFPEFINKTVVSTLPGFSCSELILGQFIYGDSVGRHLYDDYCHYLGMKGERRAFPDEKEPVIYWEGTICTEPALNFKVMHLHNYGESLRGPSPTRLFVGGAGANPDARRVREYLGE
jgi:hypothetical protein